MARYVGGLLLLLAALGAARAQQPGEAIKLTIHPAALPAPLFKYPLLPSILEQQPGNGALLYYRTFSPEWMGWMRKPGIHDKLSDALQAPLGRLPREELGWIVDAKQFQELDLGARREYCDWGFTTRVRSEGIGMLLPDIQSFRTFAQVVALRARFHLAERNFDKAAYSLQTGLQLGKDIAHSPTLITGLVGIAVAGLQAGQIDEWLQTPGSPNLYWSLTDLPRPFVDMHRPLQGERLWLYADLPRLRDIETAPFGPHETHELTERLVRLMRAVGDIPSDAEAKLVLMAMALKFYPQARRELLDSGRKPEEVEAMPMLQVFTIHSFREFRKLQDEVFKWYALPYPQALAGLNSVDAMLKEHRTRLTGAPFVDLLPAIARVLTATARLDRRLAAQRCIEAIRLYAATHDGKLPAALADITDVPVPDDPMLGKPFVYESNGDRAKLHAAAPAGTSPNNALTYELTLSP
jgi:hypothetical protein